MFVELPDGHIVNTDYIVRLKDITGTGYYRVIMDGGFTVDLAEDESEKLKRVLLHRSFTEEDVRLAFENAKGSEEYQQEKKLEQDCYVAIGREQEAARREAEVKPKRKPGRPKKTHSE